MCKKFFIVLGDYRHVSGRKTAVTSIQKLEKLATAGMMFYSDNAANLDKNGTLDGTTEFKVEDLQTGINAYLKTEDEVGKEAVANTYFVAIDGTAAAMTWLVGYQFGTSDGEVQAKKAMKNKTNRMKLKLAAAGADYAGGDTVYMKIR